MKTWLKDNRGFLIFLLCFAFFRTALADWNPIPSGSMRPTLVEGDVVLVNRLAYDFKLPLTDVSVLRLGTPQRGDVITFTSPKDGVRLIKRLVAVPGDTVELRDDRLFLNGVEAQYDEPAATREPVGNESTPALRTTERLAGAEHAVQFLPAVPAMRDFGPAVVPADTYFFLGDNRDNSADSRLFGPLPLSAITGRVISIWMSRDLARIGDL